MKLKKYIYDLYSILKTIYLTFVQSFKKTETNLYPEQKPIFSKRYKGRIILTKDPDGKERCVACGLCSAVCPPSCISLKKGEYKNGIWYAKSFTIDISKCIFCGFCEEACPTLAIQFTNDMELPTFKKEDLIRQKNDMLVNHTGKHKIYNFYSKSSIRMKNTNNKTDEAHYVDVKKILP